MSLIVRYFLLLWFVCSTTWMALFFSGYIVRKAEIKREERCINSVCEGKCKTKFIRHQGVCEK